MSIWHKLNIGIISLIFLSLLLVSNVDIANYLALAVTAISIGLASFSLGIGFAEHRMKNKEEKEKES